MQEPLALEFGGDQPGQEKAKPKKEKSKKDKREKRERKERKDKPKITTPVSAATWWRVQKRDGSKSRVVRMSKRDKGEEGDEDARDSD